MFLFVFLIAWLIVLRGTGRLRHKDKNKTQTLTKMFRAFAGGLGSI